MPSQYTPRISVEVSEDTFNRFTNIIPWGLRSRVLSIMVEDLLHLIEKHGEIVLTALVRRAIGTEQIVQDLAHAIKEGSEKDGTTRP